MREIATLTLEHSVVYAVRLEHSQYAGAITVRGKVNCAIAGRLVDFIHVSAKLEKAFNHRCLTSDVSLSLSLISISKPADANTSITSRQPFLEYMLVNAGS